MIVSSVKRWIRKNIVLTLILVNVVMFIVVNVMSVVGDPMNVINSVALSGNVLNVASRPWTVVTYMFTQWNFIHLLVNMLWLWMFGRLWHDLDGLRYMRFLMAYIVSGITAAIVFEVINVLMPSYGAGILVGSSGAVVGVIAYVTLKYPGYPVRLMFLGNMKLWVVALISVGLCLLSDISGNLAGGVAHLGGAIGGGTFGLIHKYNDRRREGRRKFYFGVRQECSRMSLHTRDRVLTPEQELDKILDKVKRTGYGGLTAHEQQRLYELSRNL